MLYIKASLISILCVIILVGCNSSQHADMHQPASQAIEKAKEKEAPARAGQYPIRSVNRENIVSSQYGMADYAVAYPNIPALAENSEIIIYGEVAGGYFYAGMNGLLQATEDVKILKVIKGDFQPGDIVKVAKDQGVVSVSDYLASFTSEEAQRQQDCNFIFVNCTASHKVHFISHYKWLQNRL